LCYPLSKADDIKGRVCRICCWQ